MTLEGNGCKLMVLADPGRLWITLDCFKRLWKEVEFN